MDKVTEVDELSEIEISEFVTSSKEWKKSLEKFQSTKESIDLEIISTSVDTGLQKKFEETFNTMKTAVLTKVEVLSKADKELGLFSFDDNKGKKAVEYPKKFCGNKGEDVFKFIKDFKDALSADRVRKADEIKVLLKYLDGKAKTSIGDHFKDVEEALKQLKETYGVPRFIVDEYFKRYEEKFGNPKKWGKQGSQLRLDAIDGTLDFIRQMKSLATDHKSLKNVIYNDRTLELLAKGMPLAFSIKQKLTNPVPTQMIMKRG